MAKNAVLRAQGRADEVFGRSKAQREAGRENWRKTIIALAEHELMGFGQLDDAISEKIKAMRRAHAKEVAEEKATQAVLVEQRAELVDGHESEKAVLKMEHADEKVALQAQIEGLKSLLDARTALTIEQDKAIDNLRHLVRHREETIAKLETVLANS